MAHHRFRKPLPGGDFLDFSFLVERGEVTELSVNYTALIDGRHQEVIRWDTNHGHLHVHRFWLGPAEQVEDLEDPGDPKKAYKAALTSIERELRLRHEDYRRKMERKDR